jgi:hypothetical protein
MTACAKCGAEISRAHEHGRPVEYRFAEASPTSDVLALLASFEVRS